LQGAFLFKALKTDGLEGFPIFLKQWGLHSPYSTFLAAASFAALGPSRTSPYYCDALLVFLYLVGIGYFLRKLSLAVWCLALGLFLTPPFITMGVVEFRPDIAWAVAAGFGVVWIIVSERIFLRPNAALGAGILFALALLI
jgi:hypothetical protein